MTSEKIYRVRKNIHGKKILQELVTEWRDVTEEQIAEWKIDKQDCRPELVEQDHGGENAL
jgi:hypothetical protein